MSEHGCAEIFGHSQDTQAQLLIEHVADPRARQELTDAARALGLRRGFD